MRYDIWTYRGSKLTEIMTKTEIIIILRDEESGNVIAEVKAKTFKEAENKLWELMVGNPTINKPVKK